MIKTVRVIHPHDKIQKEYKFKTNLDLVIGDTVVCDTKYGYVVGIVTIIEDGYDDKVTRWIVKKLETVVLNATKKRLQNLVNVINLKSQVELIKEKLVDEQEFYLKITEIIDLKIKKIERECF